jgi:CheY-like chemotaxis protein
MTDSRQPRILLVDDNKHLLVTLGDFLRFEGMDVHLARSGEEALSRIGEHEPDLIVLDICMPGMGGIGFLKAITREDGSLKHPVLVLTARGAMEEFFGTLPVDGFLAKPCAERDLLDKIRDILLARSRTAQSARRPQRKVLLAEDDPRFAERVAAAFEGASVSCDLVVLHSARELLEKAFADPPDLVLLKQLLHGMNGAEAVSLLRLMPRTNPVPALLYSPDHVMDLGSANPRAHNGGEVRILTAADAADLVRHAEDILSRSAAGAPPGSVTA